MAVVYSRVGGRKLTKVIAVHRTVQNELDRVVRKAAAKASADLAGHRVSGAARITTETGDVDRYLVLDDERGLKAAMSIEFGRGPMTVPDRHGNEVGVAAAEGLFILHKATGLPHGGA